MNFSVLSNCSGSSFVDMGAKYCCSCSTRFASIQYLCVSETYSVVSTGCFSDLQLYQFQHFYWPTHNYYLFDFNFYLQILEKRYHNECLPSNWFELASIIDVPKSFQLLNYLFLYPRRLERDSICLQTIHHHESVTYLQTLVDKNYLRCCACSFYDLGQHS